MGQYLQAHKIVLRAASTVLKNLLLTQTDSMSVIFMTSVSNNVLQAILEYIYLKKVVISKDDMDGFMDIATDIDIKGIDKDGFMKIATDMDMEGIDMKNKRILYTEKKPSKVDSLIKLYQI